MTSHPYASTRMKAKKRAVTRNAAAQAHQSNEAAGHPAAEAQIPSPAKPLAYLSQAKHRRLSEMLHDLRAGAEALSANADNLLSRLS